jgi:hypothetical protein
MLPREIVEELLCWTRPASSHVGEAFADTVEGFGVVLTLPFQVFGEGFIECPGGVCTAPPGEVLKLGQPLC